MLACIAEAHNCPAARSPWYGPDRPKWLGPLNYSYDTYQTGDAPGDYAYDILQLGRDQKAFERYYELEILHSRWAMLGALGALIPGILFSQIFSYQRRGCISSAGRKYGMAFARDGNTDGAVPMNLPAMPVRYEMRLSYAEILQYTGLSFSEARWWAVGRAKAEGEDLNYFGIEGLRIAGGQGIIIIAVCQVSLCVPESKPLLSAAEDFPDHACRISW
jgi:light-harvesting complex II chlorophyll a/b binding protein 7